MLFSDADITNEAITLGLTNPVTETVWLLAPSDVSVTLPDILPVGAVAADRTSTTTLLTVPPVWESVTVLLYPLPAASETSKPAGAVAVMLPVKPVPETVNCCICGLTDAVPAQAEIGPVAAVTVMVGDETLVGFTVMV
jgi:hypothetical protein